MRTLFFLIFLLSLSSSGFAKNRVVYFGGGTSKGGDKQFNPGLRSTVDFAKKSGWEGDYYYRKVLPKKLSTEDAGKVKEFSESNFHDKLDQLLKDTQPGEQLLVVLASHGANVNGSLVVESDSGIFDVDQLHEFIKAAEAKGIKLGIVGGACYSGSLMKFKTKSTCIITDAPRDKVGTVGDTTGLLTSIAANRSESNLEELYLRNRLEAAGKGYGTMPMISTEVGTAVDEMLYPIKFSVTRKFDLPYFLTRPVCTKTDLAMSTLQQSIDDQADVGLASMGDEGKLSYKKLKDKTNAYDNKFAEAKDVVLMSAKKECVKVQGQEICMTLGSINKFMKNRAENAAKSPDSVKVVDELSKSEAFKNYSSIVGSWDSKLNDLEELGKDISNSERLLYDHLYKKMSQDPRMKSAPNPCRDFKI